MHTIREETHIVGDSAYWGERGDWLIAAAVHRDSNVLDRSNWEEWQEAMQPYEDDWAIECFSHWAVGWVDYLVIRPGSPAVNTANELHEQLENYPVLSDDRMSEMELDEATDYWAILALAERVELCERFGCTIFAARHDYLPQDDPGGLFEYLRGD